MKKSKKIGVGVIGLRMGRGHLEGYLKNPHCSVVAVCDTNKETLSKIRDTFNIPVAVSEYQDLISRSDIDIVSVASPDFEHAEQSIAAMRAGKDVLCEKPMTATIEDARAIIASVKETGRRFMVGQTSRYAPGFALAKKMVERGDVGELYYVESEYAHDYQRARGVGDWRVDPRREPFLGGGCHAVDLLRWIAGDAEEVTAYSNHKCLTDWPVDDCTVAIYKFGQGVIGKVFVSIGCIRPYTMRTVLYGTEGTIVCDNTSKEIFLCNRKNFEQKPVFASFPVDIISHNMYAEINEFVNKILTGEPILLNEIEGAKTVATALAAVKSAQEKRSVVIKEML
ncbi:MAG: Gfo/Idh/MocA family oxidoreductase [Candidatus Ratteibacteria bacterium]|jgi:UDP-N-acetylglucosamine 3-dehydrogenase